jgi:hypothetical protein
LKHFYLKKVKYACIELPRLGHKSGFAVRKNYPFGYKIFLGFAQIGQTRAGIPYKRRTRPILIDANPNLSSGSSQCRFPGLNPAGLILLSDGLLAIRGGFRKYPFGVIAQSGWFGGPPVGITVNPGGLGPNPGGINSNLGWFTFSYAGFMVEKMGFDGLGCSIAH